MYRHAPIIYSNSEFGAWTVECAADQGAFWPAFDAYMGLDGSPQPSGGNRELFQREGAVWLGEQLGLDADQFGECLDDDEGRAAAAAQWFADFRQDTIAAAQAADPTRTSGTTTLRVPLQLLLEIQSAPNYQEANEAFEAVRQESGG